MPTILPEEVFWISQRSQNVCFDLWSWKPELRKLMRAPQLWNGLVFGLVTWLFVAVNLALWLGPRASADNLVLKLFWAW